MVLTLRRAPQGRKILRLECIETDFAMQKYDFIGQIFKIFAAAQLKRRPNEPFGLVRRPFGSLSAPSPPPILREISLYFPKDPGTPPHPPVRGRRLDPSLSQLFLGN